MLALIMRDKSLTCTATAKIYQYENNADEIKCLIPNKYNDVDLMDATVLMFFKDESGNGGQIELKKSSEIYKNGYLQFNNLLDTNITQYSGRITIWLKIYNFLNNFKLESNEAFFEILPSKEIPKDFNHIQQSYFDEWIIKMKQIENTALKVLKDSTKQTNIVRKEIEKLKNNVYIIVDTKYKKGGDNVL